MAMAGRKNAAAVRCAIYTRKSTDEGLESLFQSPPCGAGT